MPGPHHPPWLPLRPPLPLLRLAAGCACGALVAVATTASSQPAPADAAASASIPPITNPMAPTHPTASPPSPPLACTAQLPHVTPVAAAADALFPDPPWPAGSALGLATLGVALMGAMLAVPAMVVRAGSRSATPLPGPVAAATGVLTTPSAVRSLPGAARLIAAPDTARFQNIATDTVLELAQRMADQEAAPAALLQELAALDLPVQPMSEQICGVMSVTGNSIKGWNEDTALAFRSLHPLLGPLEVLMAFDGMGGLPDGKLASKFGALAMAIELHRQPDTVTTDPARHLASAFERVNRRFRKAGAALYGQVDGNALRSTAIVVVADARQYLVAHLGDGHAHLRRADGSRLALMEAHKGTASNAVTHSLGPVPDGEPRLTVQPRAPGDLVFIASDGFDPVPADQLLEALHVYGQQHPLQAVVAGLTDDCCGQCDAHGPIANDNMTLVALHTPELALEPAPACDTATTAA